MFTSLKGGFFLAQKAAFVWLLLLAVVVEVWKGVCHLHSECECMKQREGNLLEVPSASGWGVVELESTVR